MHSWNDATTRPARLRVVNNSKHDVHVLWVTEAGKEITYSSLAPCDMHMQSARACLLLVQYYTCTPHGCAQLACWRADSVYSLLLLTIHG